MASFWRLVARMWHRVTALASRTNGIWTRRGVAEVEASAALRCLAGQPPSQATTAARRAMREPGLPQAVISYAGPSLPEFAPLVSDYPFVPCLKARVGGELLFTAWVQLDFVHAVNAMSDLGRLGMPDKDAFYAIGRAILLYGVRRVESYVADLLATNATPDVPSQRWELTDDDLPQLLELASSKSCSYQERVRRDLYCAADVRADPTKLVIGGRTVAPTSRPLCAGCGLPSDDFLCSHLLHPKVHAKPKANASPSSSDYVERELHEATCDLGRQAIKVPRACQPAMNDCWQRIVEVESPLLEPISPFSLPEAFESLDAFWRLAFGKTKRLAVPGTFTGAAALSHDCTSRPEFESRLSALADTIDKLKVDKSLLPSSLADDEIKGSLDGLEKCLLHQLPVAHHPAIANALQTLRRVRQARNAIQHGISQGGGLTAKLRELGIHDAPPNWAGAWDSVRVQTINALTVIRDELRRW